MLVVAFFFNFANAPKNANSMNPTHFTVCRIMIRPSCLIYLILPFGTPKSIHKSVIFHFEEHRNTEFLTTSLLHLFTHRLCSHCTIICKAVDISQQFICLGGSPCIAPVIQHCYKRGIANSRKVY